MNTHKKNLNHQILAQFSGNTSFLTIPKIYYRLTKNLNKAFLLSQIIFYSDKSTHCKDGWFYKTYEDWQEEVELSIRGIRDLFKSLQKSSLIDMRVAKVNGVRTPFFKPRLDDICKAIESLLSTPIKEKKQKEQLSSQTAESAVLLKNVPKRQRLSMIKNVPKRQKVPNSQTAEIAVSIYTQNITTEKKTTTSKESGGSSFLKTKQKMLAQKCVDDLRSDEEFLENCDHHIQNNSTEPSASLYKRSMMLICLLKSLLETGEHFKSKGYVNTKEEKLKKEQELERRKLQAEAQEKQHWERIKELQQKTIHRKPAITDEQRRNGIVRCAELFKMMGVQRNANA